jgi:hypothetical protein
MKRNKQENKSTIGYEFYLSSTLEVMERQVDISSGFNLSQKVLFAINDQSQLQEKFEMIKQNFPVFHYEIIETADLLIICPKR